MRLLTLAETADYLEAATIESTQDHGHALIHIGRSGLGLAFVLMNDAQGETILVEGM